MKVLSLLQPWASLVVLGAKQFEVRSWSTAYRGPLLIHASGRKLTRREKMLWEADPAFSRFVPNTDLLPYGALIGRVALVAIYPTEWLLQHLELVAPQHRWQQELAFDDYGPRRFAWHFTHPEVLRHQLPVKGTLGLWDYAGGV